MRVSDRSDLSEPWPPTGTATELFPLAYDELKRLAIVQMSRERKDHTLTPTALLHEAYLRVCQTADGFARFIHRQQQALGDGLVLGLEAREGFGGVVKGVVNAFATEEQAVTVFHGSYLASLP